MKNKLIACAYILLLIVCLKLSFDFVYNAIVVHKYNQNDYSMDEGPILFLNCFQPYIAHYNNGNIYYQQEKYPEAVEAYQRALEHNPPKKKECSIRINLALAMIAMLGEDYDKPEKVEDSIALLKDAKEVLLEKDCATEEGDGHSDTAETLKREIEEEIERLENQAKQESKPDDKPEKEPQTEEEKEQEEKLKQQLQEKQNSAQEQRQEALKENEELDMNIDFNYGGVVW